MLIVFRADASLAIGGGHVMRCLTLAQELRASGCEVMFLTSSETVTSVSALGRSGLPYGIVAGDPEDARKALATFGHDYADAIVVDSYALSEVYERALRDFARRIVVIDDLPTRRHDCDMIIDQTFGRAAASYKDLVPKGATVLAGSSYVLMRSEFRALRPATLARRANEPLTGRILVSLGMTDLGAHTRPIVEALAEKGWPIDVVLGTRSQASDTVADALRALPAVDVHIDPPSMAELMVQADIGVGGAGTTTWERCCLGLPSVLIALADNQKDVANRLGAGGLAIHVDPPTPSAVADACSDLLGSDERWRLLSSRTATVCDGLGARRAAEAMLDLCRKGV